MPTIDLSQQTQMNKYPTVPSSKVPIAICYTAFCVNKPTTMYCTAMCHGDAKIHAL